MKPSDSGAFAQLLTDVMATYRQDVSRFILDVWWAACQPFTMEQFRKAVNAHLTDADRGQFAPKIADIVRILAGTRTERSMLAWGKVQEAMGSVGAYTDVVFDDPAIHATIEDLGGWPKVCRHPSEELGYLQHRFCEGHKAYTGRDKFDFPRRLMGDRSPDHEYQAKGLPMPKPALIGDVDLARAVFHSGNLAGKTTITYQAAPSIVGMVSGALRKEAA